MNTPSKDPSLKIRYAMGLGDFVACLLHSRLLGKLTKLITGKSKPCQTCSLRAQALNILFPIPFWRLFFFNKENMLKSYQQELEAFGYKVKTSPDGSVSGIKTEVIPNITPPQPSSKPLFPELVSHRVKSASELDFEYMLINSYDTKSGDFLIRTQIFKSK
jgi:hypothetical protein